MNGSPQRPQTNPTPAGMYDYLLGGHHHSPTDRAAAEQALAVVPEARIIAAANRDFLGRAVRYLAEQGIRQYIDLGSGFPAGGAVHEIAAKVVADPHVLYVDYDPFVVAYSRQLLADHPNTGIIAQDLRYPWDIIDAPETARLIDWSQPVALLMVAIVHFVSDRENPGEIIATFRDLMVAGSYLVLSHVSHGDDPENVETAARSWDQTRSAITVRSPSDIDDLFVGFDLVEPGLVPTAEWRTSGHAGGEKAPVLAGMGRVS